jgi:hypothetical protein
MLLWIIAISMVQRRIDVCRMFMNFSTKKIKS